MDKTPAPSLLPILRSQQQAELLALLLGDPELELSLTDLADRTGIPYASIHREVKRAASAGLLATQQVGRTRLVRADTTSPYYEGLADILTKAFGVHQVLGRALSSVPGIDRAYVYGSWAARFQGSTGARPVGDIDVLVLGEPNRDRLYQELVDVERRLGRPVQVTIRDERWLERGTGSFHDTVAARDLVEIPLAVPPESSGEA